MINCCMYLAQASHSGPHSRGGSAARKHGDHGTGWGGPINLALQTRGRYGSHNFADPGEATGTLT